MEGNTKPTVGPTAPAGAGAGVGSGAKADRVRPGRGRGQPPNQGAEPQVGKGQVADKVNRNEVGKIPHNYRDCKDAQKRDVCVKFQSGDCNEGAEGFCWSGAKPRMHVCATIKSLSKLTLCLSKEHGHKDCPFKAQ